jgi:hypothetical protein
VNNMPTLIYHWTNYVIAKHALISNIIHNIFNLRYTKIALFIREDLGKPTSLTSPRLIEVPVPGQESEL